MGEFAALYPLPAGEQLLVLLIDDADLGPAIQYVTEVHGAMVSATVHMLSPADNGNYLKRLSAKEEARQMIGNLDEESVKTIRRRFVRDIAGDENTFTKEELEPCQPN